MCLDTITAINPKTKKRIGYKVVEKISDKKSICFVHKLLLWFCGKYYSPLYYGSYLYRRSWNITTAKYPININLFLGDGVYKTKSYETGFHMFKNIAGAKDWRDNVCQSDDKRVIVKVEYADVTTFGIQEGFRVVVAKKFRILKEY